MASGAGRKTGGCMDLGVCKPDSYASVARVLSEEQFDFVVLMEDRQPDFFLTYDGFNAESYTRLNRHGPYGFGAYHPTHTDMKRFVRTLHDSGIGVMYGFWIHENRWIARRHPELLLTDCNGKIWATEDYSSDINPLLLFEQDDSYFGIKNGDRFSDYVCRQYDKISNDFGFGGLFVGDGGLGFRVFGKDGLGANFYDYSYESLDRFTGSEFFAGTHADASECNLGHISQPASYEKPGTYTIELSGDIHAHHQDQFVNWACAEWSLFYGRLADFVHSKGNRLAAYSCMNYSADEARSHGVDYSAIAKAGLDFLVFQTYAFAWGEHFRLERKDTATNLENLQSVKRQLQSQPSCKVLFTTETRDSVENWRCPVEKTLRQVESYSGADPAPDGLFVVWLNETTKQELSQIRATINNAGNYPRPVA